MNSSARFNYLYLKYIQNTCTRLELEEFFEYVNDPVYEPALRALMTQSWQTSPEEEVSGLQNEGEESADVESQRNPAITTRKVRWMAAASVAVLLATGITLFLFPREQSHVSTSVESSLPTTVRSTQGERRLITLPDGTSVWLNRDSKLNFPEAFAAHRREVSLEGEAFFEVMHDPQRPFIISCGRVTTTVLGTAFNIRAFPEEKSVTVTVKTGKVMVQDELANKNILVANQQIMVDRSANKAATPVTRSAQSVTDWIEEDLILDNITLENATAIIEERYAVEVEFANNDLKRCRFTSTFLRDASLLQMLTAISIVNRATFEIEDGKVTLFGEGCPQVPN